jgi:molecular chaperone GrpE
MKKAEEEIKKATKDAAKEKKDPKDLKIEELTNLVKRVQADFENFKKQQEKEKAEFCKYASAELLKKFLPLLDSFQLALKSNNDIEEFKKGLELIYSQFWQIMESEGIKPIESVGKKLDPFCHEVLLQEKSDKPENTVIEELQRGYMLKEAVLRPAKVKIAKSKEDDKK